MKFLAIQKIRVCLKTDDTLTFIYLKGRQTDRLPINWFTPPNTLNGQDWAKLKSGVENSMWVFNTIWVAGTLLPPRMPVSKKLELREAARLKRKHSSMGGRHLKWQFKHCFKHPPQLMRIKCNHAYCIPNEAPTTWS